MDEHDRLEARLLELDQIPIPPDPGFPAQGHRPSGTAFWLLAGAAVLLIVITLSPQARDARNGTGSLPALASPASPGPSALMRQGPSPSELAASIPPRPALPAGQCTSPTTSGRELIDNYLGLTTSGDVDAVRDCFSRQRPEYAAGNPAWATAGPITSATVTYRYPLRGCQWFQVRAEFARGNPEFPQQASTTYFKFIAVGRDGESLRIQDQATALVQPEFENNPGIQLPTCSP